MRRGAGGVGLVAAACGAGLSEEGGAWRGSRAGWCAAEVAAACGASP